MRTEKKKGTITAQNRSLGHSEKKNKTKTSSLTVMHEQRGIPGQGQFGIGEGGVRSVLGGGGVAEACGLLIERVLVRVLGTVSARRVLSF